MHPASTAEFQVTGHKSGVGTVSYDLEGVNKYDFTVPDDSFIFIGRNISREKSIYTRLGMLVGNLPIGCQTKEIGHYPACDIKVAFYKNSTKSNSPIESGPVHIITPDNKTIPLSLIGYDFSVPHLSRKEILERLVRLTNITEQRQTSEQNTSANGCTDNQLSAGDLFEFIQEDALPKSFLKYLSDQLPLWLKVRVRDNSDMFHIENTLANLVQTTDTREIHSTCKFPINSQSSIMILYRPVVNFNISVDNEELSLSSKGSCFSIDVCNTGMFLTLSSKGNNKVRTLQFLQDMADGGWKLLVSSFGFTTTRRYFSRIVNHVPDGHFAENFTNFDYNLWLQGSANILLNNSSYFAVNLNITGEAFVFTEDLNAVGVTCFVTHNTCDYDKFYVTFFNSILYFTELLVFL